MTYAREPVLQPVPIESLRPTQITVGMREVEEKRKRLRQQKPQKIGSFIGRLRWARRGCDSRRNTLMMPMAGQRLELAIAVCSTQQLVYKQRC